VPVQKYLNPLVVDYKILFKIQKDLFCRLPNFGLFFVGNLVRPLVNFHLFFGLPAHRPTLSFSARFRPSFPTVYFLRTPKPPLPCTPSSVEGNPLAHHPVTSPSWKSAPTASRSTPYNGQPPLKAHPQ
jgi:hypothetical protein